MLYCKQNSNQGEYILMITIRPATLQDLDTITEIEAICFPAAEAASKESFRSRLIHFPEHFFVALDKDKIIGFINGAVINSNIISDELYEDASLHDPHGAYQTVFGLDVLPDYQHQGIASALMEYLIDTAKSHNRKGIILTCKEHLIPFYNRFGYENQGVSASVHGGACWYDMLLSF